MIPLTRLLFHNGLDALGQLLHTSESSGWNSTLQNAARSFEDETPIGSSQHGVYNSRCFRRCGTLKRWELFHHVSSQRNCPAQTACVTWSRVSALSSSHRIPKAVLCPSAFHLTATPSPESATSKHKQNTNQLTLKSILNMSTP